MQNNEIYYVSEGTYKKFYDYCANKLLAAEMKNSEEPSANSGYFWRVSAVQDTCNLMELESLFTRENISTDTLETIENCPADLLPKVIRETLRKFVVGKGENVKPGTQYVSRETYFYILADIAETLIYEFLSRHDLPSGLDVEGEFYEWFNERIDTNSSNISEMIIRDGASPKLIIDLTNRAEDFEELIVEILDTFRVKPF